MSLIFFPYWFFILFIINLTLLSFIVNIARVEPFKLGQYLIHHKDEFVR